VIISVINQKGGVGKTTTVSALCNGLKARGYKVLAVDLDAQGNLTYSFGASSERSTVLGVLTGEVSAKDAIQHTEQGDIISSSKSLIGADAFLTDTGKEYTLKEGLEAIKKDYDFIILDTPPTLGILTVNALTASDTVVIPAQADIFSLQGIEQLSNTIRPVKKYTNKDLTINGILLVRYNPRSVLSKEVSELADQLAQRIDTTLYKATIREAIAVKECAISQRGLFEYAPKSNVATDYNAFIDELLQRINN